MPRAGRRVPVVSHGISQFSGFRMVTMKTCGFEVAVQAAQKRGGHDCASAASLPLHRLYIEASQNQCVLAARESRIKGVIMPALHTLWKLVFFFFLFFSSFFSITPPTERLSSHYLMQSK